ncbi:hypothetical protein GQ43DRAFT_439733 [Delitschia confertaspora ATCC 74209]|uniref:Uncharacterized protein n=1 Tax=Delitschia confertaspora ATCC 74209 TaxID=1513339 RepID=A0A9P4JN85_9PLEO|nr:hypothetical protein GQ43DRAFT_439733 [Delitschia confertaspora ATCC 74209]
MAVRDGLKPEGTNRAASRSEDSDATPTSSSPRPHDLPTGTTKSDTEGNKEVIEGKGAQHSVTLSAKKLKRLSIPPSVQLAPSVQTPWTASLTPRKSNGSFSFEYKPHPAYQMEDWAERTPTPIRSVREGLSTPPLIKRVPGLVSAVTNALKKRSENGGSAEEVRSMSIEGCVKS